MLKTKRNLVLFLIVIVLLGLTVMGCNSSLELLGASTPEATSSPAPTVEATATPEPTATPEVTPEATAEKTAAPQEYPLAPEFILTDLDGNEVSLSDFRGSPILLNFWATWCGPCRVEMPHLEEVANAWLERGLVVLTISEDRNASTARDYMSDNGLSLTVLMDVDGAAGSDYGVSGIPTTYFIDVDGFAVGRRVGGYSNVSEIERDLGQTLYP